MPIQDAILRSQQSGIRTLDRSLQGPDFFNGIEFDTITFKSTSAERVSQRKWTVKGNLSMLGKTEPIEAAVEALRSLGYGSAEAEDAVRRAVKSLGDRDVGTQDLVKNALQFV